MKKLNEEAAPNLNLSSQEIIASHLISNQKDHEFSEELSDGGERDEMIRSQSKS